MAPMIAFLQWYVGTKRSKKKKRKNCRRQNVMAVCIWIVEEKISQINPILTGKENIVSSHLFQKARTTDLRGHSLKLPKRDLD